MSKEALLDASDRALIAGIVIRQRRENEKEAAAAATRLAEARIEARRLSSLIAKQPGVRRILHFGSSATGRSFRLDSDIDLGIEGGDILAAMSMVECSRFKVEVVDLKFIPDRLREAIFAEGIVVYENS
jgi:predicted nucleotidyltransferase